MWELPLREIAQELNNRNIPAPRGGAWGATSVMRVMKRLGITGKAPVAELETEPFDPRALPLVGNIDWYPTAGLPLPVGIVS